MNRFWVSLLMLALISQPIVLAAENNPSPSPSPSSAIQAAGAEEADLINDDGKDIDTLGIGKELGFSEELEEGDEFDDDDNAKSIGVEEIHTKE